MAAGIARLWLACSLALASLRARLSRALRAVRSASIALSCAAMLAACPMATMSTASSTPHEPPTIPLALAWIGGDYQTAYDLVSEAGSILGYSIRVQGAADEYGAITVVLHHADSPAVGYALVTEGCRRAVWAEPRAEVIAHEIGHALGLNHEPDANNLMFFAESGGVQLTSKQRRTVARELASLNACTEFRPR